jgi:hypothetical protein
MSKNHSIYYEFLGLRPSIFERAAEIVGKEGRRVCCCPAISYAINGKDDGLWTREETPYHFAFSAMFHPWPDDKEFDNSAWWNNSLASFEVEARVIALLICAEIAREVNEKE